MKRRVWFLMVGSEAPAEETEASRQTSFASRLWAGVAALSLLVGAAASLIAIIEWLR